MFALLKPTFSLPFRPQLLAATASTYDGTLPYRLIESINPTASVHRLAPFIFGARALD